MLSNKVILGANGVIKNVKSVIFDIADNWGGSPYMGVRSIEFFYWGTLIPMNDDPGATFVAYSTTNTSGFLPEFAFDTTESKTGSTGFNWISQSNQITNQRLIIVFNQLQTFDRIIINNYHSFGVDTDYGARNVTIIASEDPITDTTYNSPVSNSTLLNVSEWPEHVPSDVIDDQTVWTA